MTSFIQPKPGIFSIDPYVGGQSGLPGSARIHKLSSNENPLGPSPAAIAAFQQAGRSLELYPSTDHKGLREAIAEVHGLDPARIICGDGSDEIIAWLCHAYAGPGDEVLFPRHGFSMYRISAYAAGATPLEAEETNRRVDVDHLLAAANEKTRLVFLANPGNPTGTMISQAEIARLADGLPPAALLVLDGAYAECVAGYDGGQSLIETRDNILMTRTFSKIYGLSGLRVGWAFGPAAIIDVLNRLRGPFNVTSASLAAAEAAVRDQAHVRHCRAEITRARDVLTRELAEIGIPSDPSSANFILARFKSEAVADAADKALKEERVIVRRVKGYGLPQCLRITIGTHEACRLVVDVLKRFMEGRH